MTLKRTVARRLWRRIINVDVYVKTTFIWRQNQLLFDVWFYGWKYVIRGTRHLCERGTTIYCSTRMQEKIQNVSLQTSSSWLRKYRTALHISGDITFIWKKKISHPEDSGRASVWKTEFFGSNPHLGVIFLIL